MNLLHHGIIIYFSSEDSYVIIWTIPSGVCNADKSHDICQDANKLHAPNVTSNNNHLVKVKPWTPYVIRWNVYLK